MPERPAPLLESLSARFELRGTLGMGSMGVVHRAFDHQLGREVALKTLRGQSLELFFNLKEEFRAAASLAHPNLVELYELFVEGSECCFTMELLDGVSFDRWVREPSVRSTLAPGDSSALHTAATSSAVPAETESGTRRSEGPSAEALAGPATLAHADAAERLASAAAQLVRAVAALHAAGRLHCDLKPSNILVTTGGRLVVLDFGLSSPLWGQQARLGFSGTLAYAAPEQLWGGELTPATDWYSVGVVLYQALTGELPRGDGQHRASLARAWIALALESKARLPVQFASLVAALLHLDPAERPALATIVRILDAPRQLRDAPRSEERLFVGRAAELATLQRCYLAASAGWLSAVDVHGESGIGKTELVRQFSLQAADEAALLVRGQCRLDESVPYQALDQVIDDLSKHLCLLSAEELQTFLPDDFSSLVRLFPVLGRLARSEKLPDEIEGSVVRQRAAVALRQMLWRLCAFRPLILWVDDANWGDAESQSLLCDLLREPAPPLLLILSHREAGAAWLRPIAEAVAQAQGQWVEIEAQPLDDDASRELVEKLLGPLARERPVLVQRVASESAHVPLFIGQLCRLLAETSAPEGDPREPLTLFEVIERRVAALAADERRVAELVALIDAPVPVGVIAAAAGLSADKNLIVSRLAAAQLLCSSGARPDPRLSSYHQHVRETILAGLDPAARKHGHRLLAGAMQAFGPSIVPEVLLQHWRGAGEPERALEIALRAARAALDKLAFAHAAALYRTGLELLDPSGRDYNDTLEKFAQALSAAGRAVEAGEQYRLLSARARAPEALHWLRHAAENFLVGGQLDQGMAVLTQALQQVGLRLPGSSTSALVLGLLRVLTFRLSARARGRERAAPLNASEALRTDLCLSAAKGLGAVDPLLSAYFTFSALSVAARAGDPARAATALCLSGMMLCGIGGRLGRWGAEWLDEAARIAADSGDLLLRGRVLVCRAQVEVNRGHWQAVLQICEEATRWLDLHPEAATWERNVANMAWLRALEEVGQLRKAWQRAAEWRAEAKKRGDLYAQTTATLYLAFAQLAEGDADQAQALALQALAPWSAAPPPFQEFYRLRVNAYAELYRARPRAALAILVQAERTLRAARLDRVPMAILEVSLLRARIQLQLARAERQPAQALGACAREVERLDALGRSDASGYAALTRAAMEAVRGQRERARTQLAVARAQFGELQMSLGLIYVAAAESSLSGTARDLDEPLAHEISLRQLGILAPRAWLAVHAPGFELAAPRLSPAAL